MFADLFAGGTVPDSRVAYFAA